MKTEFYTIPVLKIVEISVAERRCCQNAKWQRRTFAEPALEPGWIPTFNTLLKVLECCDFICAFPLNDKNTGFNDYDNLNIFSPDHCLKFVYKM